MERPETNTRAAAAAGAPGAAERARAPDSWLDGGDRSGPLDVAVRLRTLLQRPLPDEELLENTRMVATPPEERARLDASLLIVALGAERLAIDIAIARRVVPLRAVHSVPHRTNELFAGLCNVGGELLPVVGLNKLLGIDEAGAPRDGAARRMLVIGGHADAWVVVVDAVEGIRRFDSTLFRAPPATVRRALDGVTDALVPLDESGRFAARLDPAKLAAALKRCLA